MIMTEWSPWIAALVLNKFLLYLAVAASAASVFMLIQSQNPALNRFSWRYGIWGAGLGLLLACVDFFLQVGLFADAGWAGLLDSSVIAMLWDSPLGSQLVWRVIGFLLLMTVLLWALWQSLKLNWLLVGVAMLALMCLSFACLQAGHTAEQAFWVRLALSAHFLLGLWWMGCLWPLAVSCKHLTVKDLQQLMQRFGTVASCLVPVLLVAGLGLAYALTGSLQHLLTTAHGQLLMMKIALVVGLLGFAAYHKLKLVPQLTEPTKALRLQRSIYQEMGLGLAVLLLTAVASSVFGPAVLMNE
jgi:putative copper resistance protein D